MQFNKTMTTTTAPDRPTLAEVTASIAFLASFAAGLITGLALLVIALLRPDDGITTTPPIILDIFGSWIGPTVLLLVSILLVHVGRVASEQRGCLPALIGLLFSLTGGFIMGLTLSVYGGAFLAAAARATLGWP